MLKSKIRLYHLTRIKYIGSINTIHGSLRIVFNIKLFFLLKNCGIQRLYSYLYLVAYILNIRRLLYHNQLKWVKKIRYVFR